MKKYMILMLAAAAVLVSCGKEEPIQVNVDDNQAAPPISFNLTANHPDATKAVKTGWESGDAIFVFFTGVEAPKHLKMSFDGSTWTSAEYDGATQTPGALGLQNGDTGTMRAVFLPFGSNATVSADGTSFTFSKTYYTYYLTATLEYTVANNEVSGAFNMTIPDGYVQFFIEDATATDEAYSLGTDAVIPVGVASIAADGTVTETSDKLAGDDMTGYAYGSSAAKGYLFSGKLNGSYSFGGYYFAKTKTANNSRADYFVTGKTLASHSAVKLPANDNVYAISYGSPNTGKWVPVGDHISVSLFSVLGTPPAEAFSPRGNWFTCNYGQSVPEALGMLCNFNAANSWGVTLPTNDQFELINNSYCSYTWLTVHGQKGVVIKADRGFLFLPAQDAKSGYYWSSTVSESDVCFFIFNRDGEHRVLYGSPALDFAVRPFQN